MSLKVYSISLGCPKNRVDSERLLGSLGLPIRPVERPEKAQLIFINTCGFIEPAVRESVRVILDAAADLAARFTHGAGKAGKMQGLTGGGERLVPAPADEAESPLLVKTGLAARRSVDDVARPLLVVAGCLVGRYGAADLAADLPEVDLWLPTAELPDWPLKLLDALQDAGKLNAGSKAISKNKDKASRMAGDGDGKPGGAIVDTGKSNRPGRLLSTGPSYAWMKISEGCGQSCSFCTIPQIRGKVRSLEADFIIDEASALLKQGVSELVLVAQDLTAWGRDLSMQSTGPASGPSGSIQAGIPAGSAAQLTQPTAAQASSSRPDLRLLLERLLPLPGLKWLRLMYLYPAGLTEDLLKFLRDAGPPFIPYFDIPLQHADSSILDAMGRPFSQSPFKVVERVRKYLPEAALRTSLITGFPGETEENFATLCRFVQEARFQNLGVFAYEAEEGTQAATLPGQIPVELRQERRDRIMELQAEISAGLLQERLGQSLDVLVDAPHPEWPGLYVGRAWFQAPEVDGLTYVSGENLRPGDLVRAEVTETFEYDLNALVP